jgi:hypothetical protein
MPISRKYFQPALQHRHDVGISEHDDNCADIDSRETKARGESVASGIDKTTSANFEVDLAKKENQAAHSLPPTVEPSAGASDAIGQTQPKTKAHRSVATGSDAPFDLIHTETGRGTAGMGITSGRRSNEKEGARDLDRSDAVDSGMERLHAESLAAGERAMRLRSADAEHLNRIHEVVGRLVELMETHSADHDDKLQTWERRLTQLETRMATNRMSQ